MLDTQVLGWLARCSSESFFLMDVPTVQLVRVRTISDRRPLILNGNLYHIPFPQGSGDTKEEGTEREKKSQRTLKVPISTVFWTYQLCYSQELSKAVLWYRRSAQAQTCRHSGVEKKGLHGQFILEEPQTVNGYCWEQTAFFRGVAPGRLSVL